VCLVSAVLWCFVEKRTAKLTQNHFLLENPSRATNLKAKKTPDVKSKKEETEGEDNSSDSSPSSWRRPSSRPSSVPAASLPDDDFSPRILQSHLLVFLIVVFVAALLYWIGLIDINYNAREAINLDLPSPLSSSSPSSSSPTAIPFYAPFSLPSSSLLLYFNFVFTILFFFRFIWANWFATVYREMRDLCWVYRYHRSLLESRAIVPPAQFTKDTPAYLKDCHVAEEFWYFGVTNLTYFAASLTFISLLYRFLDLPFVSSLPPLYQFIHSVLLFWIKDVSLTPMACWVSGLKLLSVVGSVVYFLLPKNLSSTAGLHSVGSYLFVAGIFTTSVFASPTLSVCLWIVHSIPFFVAFYSTENSPAPQPPTNLWADDCLTRVENEFQMFCDLHSLILLSLLS
jgi:hypothetical protein